jgi:translocation and assembly module TamA
VFRRAAKRRDVTRPRLSPRALAAALALAPAWIAAASAAFAEEASPYVRYRLEIAAPAALKDAIEPALDLARWKDYPNITPELLAQLARQAVGEARDALATEGYFSPDVTMDIDASEPLRVLRLKVDPGEPTRIAGIAITFAGAVAGDDPGGAARMAAVRAQWSLPAGAIFRQRDWDAAKKRATEALAALHYAAARVANSEARVDPEQHAATLTLELDSGPPVRFGDIAVSGEAKYEAARVRELAPFSRGDLYSRELLDRFQRRLVATGYFASLQVRIDDDPARADAAPVTVAVIEAPPKRLELGIGYSTDTQYRATAAWRDNNFDSAGLRLRSEARLETKLQNVGVAFDLPERSGHADSIGAKIERTDIEDLVTEQFSFGAQRKGLNERSQPQYGARYVLERQSPLGAPTDTTYATYFDYGHTWRTTDDLLSPRDGLVAQIEIGAAPSGLSSRLFGRTIGRLAWFQPLARDTDFVARLQAGAVFASASSGIPQAMLFRTGGDTTVRGYAFESLGVQQGQATVGGRYVAIANAEVIQWVREGLGVAAFVDAGNAADAAKDMQLKLGYGIGARVKSPIGPFRLDVAYGRDVRAYRIHFSVGLAF